MTLRHLTRVTATLLALVLLSACGPTASTDDETTDQDPTDQDTSEAPAGQDGTQEAALSVIMEEVPDTDIVQDLVADFETEFPGITVEIEALPYDQMRDRIVTSALAPEPTYDVVIIDNPWMVDFVSGEYLAPLDDYIDSTDGYGYDDFSGPLREIGEVDGTTYGVPFYNYALGLIYRSDLVEDVPTTIEDYQALVTQISTDDDLAGLAMQPQRGYKIFEEWANWLYAFGGSLTDDSGEVVLDSQEARDALEAYIATYESDAPSDSLNWGFDEALRSVAGGDAATMISYNWMLPTLNGEDGPAGDLAGDFELAEMPGGKAVLGAWHWGIAANTDQGDAAWDFISWISGPEIDRERVIAGGAPTRTSVLQDESVWEEGFGQGYYETVEAILEDAEPLAAGPNAEEVINIVGTHLNAAVAGEETVDEAIADAAAEAEEAFGQSGN